MDPREEHRGEKRIGLKASLWFKRKGRSEAVCDCCGVLCVIVKRYYGVWMVAECCVGLRIKRRHCRIVRITRILCVNVRGYV